MKKCLSLALATTVAVGALIGASSASAATEIGSGCQANQYFSGGEVAVSHSPLSPLPLTVPFNGVLTEWKVNVGPINFGFIEPPEKAPNLYEELYVFSAAGPKHYTVVGKADSGTVLLNTVNNYLTRIPVQAGDLLGLGGTTTVYCETPDSRDVTADFRGVPPVGATIETGEPFVGFQVPVTARIEPDVDGDGYGDETQDKCPQSAAYHEACPVVTIGSLPTVGSKAVKLHVATSLSAPVAVTATVGLGKGRQATITAPAQTVAPGSLAPFTLTLTPEVTKVLKTLSSKKALTMKITAKATNVTGSPSTTTSKVMLKGQAQK